MAEIIWGPGRIVDWVAALSNVKLDGVLLAKEPLAWGSEAVVARLTDELRVPDDLTAEGYTYLLGMEDVANVLPSIRQKKVSDRTVAEFVIHYALLDTTPAWLDDLPNR